MNTYNHSSNSQSLISSSTGLNSLMHPPFSFEHQNRWRTSNQSNHSSTLPASSSTIIGTKLKFLGTLSFQMNQISLIYRNLLEIMIFPLISSGAILSVTLAVGVELQGIITQMALEIQERHAVVQGIPLVQLLKSKKGMQLVVQGIPLVQLSDKITFLELIRNNDLPSHIVVKKEGCGLEQRVLEKTEEELS